MRSRPGITIASLAGSRPPGLAIAEAIAKLDRKGKDQPIVTHKVQIQRIRTKLKAAQNADRKLMVFGAQSHKYQIGPPASEAKVGSFEERFSLRLPECYRSFLTEVGNGGHSPEKSAAGPFYGIYPLGDGTNDLLDKPESFLNQPAILKPDMTEEEWSSLWGGDLDGVSDEDYELNLGRVYSGMLPIGSQGCTYLHALVLNGPHQGRVVNIDGDRQTPKFAFENTFLDWYERWLDEVISGWLLNDGPTWFGYTMAGGDEHLMREYATAEDHKTRLHALRGLLKLSVANEATCQKLLELCDDRDAEIRHQALQILTKFDYAMAQKPLRAHIIGDDDGLHVACQSIWMYAKERSRDWADLLRSRLPTVNKPDSFRLMSYMLKESGIDFSPDFKPFCSHVEEDIRVTSFYSLGQLKTKVDLIEDFIVGLNDPSPRVVHTILQALAGTTDTRLLPAYARLLDRFKTDEHYVLTNLKQRMREVGMDPTGLYKDARPTSFISRIGKWLRLGKNKLPADA